MFGRRVLLADSERSFLWDELDGAAEICSLRSVFEGKQEVHDLPDFGQLGDPLPELLHVRLQPLQRRVLRVGGVPPKRPDGLQQLAGHQVGEVGGPVLGDARDGDPAVAREREVPAGEVQLLDGEVQTVHGFVREEQALAILTLLSRLLKRGHATTHHLQRKKAHKPKRS